MQDPDNLSTLYRVAVKEDQRQKIRELDFGKSSSQAPAKCDINAIRGNGCTNVAVMTISSRTALLIERRTVILPMVNRNVTMIIDQNHMMRILWRINSGHNRLIEKSIETKQSHDNGIEKETVTKDSIKSLQEQTWGIEVLTMLKDKSQQ